LRCTKKVHGFTLKETCSVCGKFEIYEDSLWLYIKGKGVPGNMENVGGSWANSGYEKF
jgi:hypothetical protein